MCSIKQYMVAVSIRNSSHHHQSKKYSNYHEYQHGRKKYGVDQSDVPQKKLHGDLERESVGMIDDEGVNDLGDGR